MTSIMLTRFPNVRSALLCGVFITPAMMPVTAFAQDQVEACMQLEQAATEIDFEESEISEDEFNQIVQSNDPAQCDTWIAQINAETGVEGDVTETERARVTLEDEVVIEGRVVVNQQQPEVQVEEQSAEVMVSDQPSDVSVSQGPIDIVIRQGAPTISLDMPQPTITIEQPAPEIIVTMPDPTVDVANARPQVEVRQAEPRISMTMPEPSVELDLYQSEDPENSPGIAIEQRQQGEEMQEGGQAQAAVTMNRAEPQIIYQDGEQQQANVDISRSDPNIRIENAEPQVEITSAGEPQVNWSQTGEATVSFQEASNESGNQQQSEDSGTAMASQNDGNQNLTEQSDQTEMAQSETDQQLQSEQQMAGGPNVRREGYEGVEVEGMELTDLEGAPMFGVQDGEVGEMGRLVLSGEELETVIVDIGDLVGVEEREVEIPFSDLTVLRSESGGDLRVYIDASEERLMNYPEAG